MHVMSWSKKQTYFVVSNELFISINSILIAKMSSSFVDHLSHGIQYGIDNHFGLWHRWHKVACI